MTVGTMPQASAEYYVRRLTEQRDMAAARMLRARRWREQRWQGDYGRGLWHGMYKRSRDEAERLTALLEIGGAEIRRTLEQRESFIEALARLRESEGQNAAERVAG